MDYLSFEMYTDVSLLPLSIKLRLLQIAGGIILY